MAMWKNSNLLSKMNENYTHSDGWGFAKPVHLRSIPSEGKAGYYGDKNLLKIINGAYSDSEIYDMLSGYVFNEEDIIEPILDNFRDSLDDEYFTQYYKDEDDFDDYLKEHNEEIREQIDYILDYFHLNYRPLKK